MDDPAGRRTRRWMLRIGKTRIVPAFCDELQIRMHSRHGFMLSDKRFKFWYGRLGLRMIVAAGLLLALVVIVGLDVLRPYAQVILAVQSCLMLLAAGWGFSLVASVDERSLTFWRIGLPHRISRDRTIDLRPLGAAAVLRVNGGAWLVPLSVGRALEQAWPELAGAQPAGELVAACAKRLTTDGYLVKPEFEHLDLLKACTAIAGCGAVSFMGGLSSLLLLMACFSLAAGSDMMVADWGPYRLTRDGLACRHLTGRRRLYAWQDLRVIGTSEGLRGRVYWLLTFGNGYVLLPKRNEDANALLTEMQAILKEHRSPAVQRLAAEPTGASLVDA